MDIHDSRGEPQENDLYVEIESLIHDVLKRDVSEQQIDEFTGYISMIINKQAKKIINSDIKRTPISTTRDLRYTPSINLFICSAPPNSSYYWNQMPVYPTQMAPFPNASIPNQNPSIPYGMNSAPLNPMQINPLQMNQMRPNPMQMNPMTNNTAQKPHDDSKKKQESKHKKPKKISVQDFNQLSLKKQESAISSNVKGHKFVKSHKLLEFLSKLDGISKKERYFEVCSDNPTELINSNPELRRIYLLYNLTELLFKNNSLISSKFTKLLTSFEEVLIEIKYPSPSYDQIYSTVLNRLKNQYSNVKIAIFISGISRTDGKFYGNKDITEVRFDTTVREIRFEGSCGTFQNCHNLRKVTIPNSVTEISNFSFQFCYSLNHVTIPSSVRILGLHCFEGCRSLTDVKLPSPLPRLEPGVFKNCPYRI